MTAALINFSALRERLGDDNIISAIVALLVDSEAVIGRIELLECLEDGRCPDLQVTGGEIKAICRLGVFDAVQEGFLTLDRLILLVGNSQALGEVHRAFSDGFEEVAPSELLPEPQQTNDRSPNPPRVDAGDLCRWKQQSRINRSISAVLCVVLLLFCFSIFSDSPREASDSQEQLTDELQDVREELAAALLLIKKNQAVQELKLVIGETGTTPLSSEMLLPGPQPSVPSTVPSISKTPKSNPPAESPAPALEQGIGIDPAEVSRFGSQVQEPPQ